jgi:hypothetical protein
MAHAPEQVRLDLLAVRRGIAIANLPEELFARQLRMPESGVLCADCD